MAISLNVDPSDFKEVIQLTVKEAIQEAEARRFKDATGQILLSKAEAAKALAVSEATIDRLRAKGLPSVKLDGRVMFRPEALRRWAKESETVVGNGG